MAARFRVLGRVLDQVGDHLGEADRIALDEEGADRDRNRQVLLLGLDQRPGDLHRPRDRGCQVEPLPAQVDLAHGGARDVEEVVDQPREMGHLPLDHRPLAIGGGVRRSQPHDMERGEDGRQRVAKLVSEDGEELVLVAIRLQELPRQGFRLAPRRHRVGDLDGVNHHVVGLPARALGRLGDEVEEPFGGPVRQAPEAWILVAEEWVSSPVDPFQEVPGRACRHLRDRLPSRTPHQLLLSHQLLELGIGQHEHLVLAAHDGNGGRRLHEQRVQMFAVRVGFRSRHPLPALEFVALPLLQRDFMTEVLLPAVVLEKDAHLGDHGLGREGLDDVVDRAVGVALEDLLLLAAYGRDEDDGRVAGALPLADQRRRLEPVELGHLHVEEDERAILLEEEAQGLPTRARLDQALVQRFEDRLQRQ